MKTLLIPVLYFPFLLRAQIDTSAKGIQFVQGLNWEQIMAKAKRENKYIFVDVFATWCGPCKMMDKQVYPNDTVGRLINDRFIAVRLQMDSTFQDDKQVKSWYATASSFGKSYTIAGFPSYLFFTPEQKLVYKDIGYMNVLDFIKLVNKALDPKSVLFYSLLEDFKAGRKDYKVMGDLALFVKKVIADKTMANSIARDYKENYLDNLNEGKSFSKENFVFIGEFPNLMNTADIFFHLCYTRPDEVDRILNNHGWAKFKVNYVITKDELERKLFKDNKPIFKTPDWNKIRADIHRKYDNIDVKKLVLDYQVNYYRRLKDWEQWVKYKGQRITEYPPKLGGLGIYRELNMDGAWDAFKYCNNRTVLVKTLYWIDIAIASDTSEWDRKDYFDTKANLLYKLGKVDEAILNEEKAIKITLGLAKRGDSKLLLGAADDFNKIVDKMKNGEPTYLNEGAIW